MCATVNDVRKSFAGLRVDKRLRHQEIADFFQMTEAELIDAHVGVSKLDVVRSSPNLAKAIRLKKNWPEIIKLVEGLGEVVALTRNQLAVHEKIGHYESTSLQGDIGLVVSEDINLRLFYRQWEFAYIFEESKQAALQKSIQFFDECGRAIHKIFLLPESNHGHLDLIAKQLMDPNQDPGIFVHERREPPDLIETQLDDVDIEAFKTDWAALEDTQEFFQLLKKYRLNRWDALTLIGDDYAQILNVGAIKFLFNSAKHLDVPLTIYVGNRGAVQIYSGQVQQVNDAKEWLSILGEKFNFHLNMTALPAIWLVRKPGKYGVISSLEILDRSGEVIAIIFGQRMPGQPEPEDWRNLLKSCQTKEESFI